MRILKKNSGLTLMELIAVVIIIGITAMLAVPQYFRAREKALDKQAQVILEEIRSAERTHWMQTQGSYFPSGGSVTALNYINGNLSLDLVDDGKWSYTITDAEGFKATLDRMDSSGYPRQWYINSTMLDAVCTGTCP